MAINNLHDLFEHELKDIYDAENKLKDALRQQAAESTDPKIRQAFQAHQKETEGQIDRLKQVFEAFNKEPNRGQGCDGIDGLLEEHKSFKREKPSPEILDVFNLGAAQKVERYEITAYESLVDIATKMGLDDVVDLLTQNLEEEEKTLEKMMNLTEEVNVLDKVAKRA